MVHSSSGHLGSLGIVLAAFTGAMAMPVANLHAFPIVIVDPPVDPHPPIPCNTPPDQVRAGGDCEDGNICTADQCVNGFCQHSPRPGFDCYPDDDPCTADYCNQFGTCIHPGISGPECQDANPCTRDFCENGLCTEHVPISGADVYR